MNARDRRALWVLGSWAAAVLLYLGAQRGWDLWKEWQRLNARRQALLARDGALGSELVRLAAEQSRYQQAFPTEWKGLSEDQLRLRGQDALLEAAHKAHLEKIRLRPEQPEAPSSGRQLSWTLEGEGSLGQWVDALQAFEASQPFMSVQDYRMNVTGDPWKPESLPGEGPLLRVSVKCVWVVGL